ncbi:hypothetical protein O1611_g5706 [Lasiodiplodia mahajangana]|uniref:Uncharacterized protein n=1 Tax=Lasiodiplodia mahajangana TaxID=1108764 RepID=A0ACC2JKR7_9PEZI|nr:hypothetical protein O1611_g5706 [Lasiodiplodia mahajangana]
MTPEATPTAVPMMSEVSKPFDELLLPVALGFEDIRDLVLFIDSMAAQHPQLVGHEACATTAKEIDLNFYNSLSKEYEDNCKLQGDEAFKFACQALNSILKTFPVAGDHDGGPIRKILRDLIDMLPRKFHSETKVDALFEMGKTPEANSDYYPDVPNQLSRLSNMLFNQHQRTGNIDDLGTAISAAYGAVLLTPNPSPHHISQLNNLIVFLLSAYKGTRSSSYLDEAISIAQKAIDSLPSQGSVNNRGDVSSLFNNLGGALLSKFDATGDQQYLETAASMLESLSKDASDDDPELVNRLMYLSNIYMRQYEQTGSRDHIRKAIEIAAKAVDRPHKDDAEMAGRYTDYAYTLIRLYQLEGNEQTLREAISKAQKAVDLTPKDERGAKLASRKSNLSIILYTQYGRTGHRKDLDDAISLIQSAMGLIPEGHLDYLHLQHNLGAMLFSRYKDTSVSRGKDTAIEDLEEAISRAEYVVQTSSRRRYDYAGRLSNLSEMLQARYDVKSNIGDLDQAILYIREAIEASPNSRDRATQLGRLSNMLQARYSNTGDRSNLDEAISQARMAVQAGQRVDVEPRMTRIDLRRGMKRSITSVWKGVHFGGVRPQGPKDEKDAKFIQDSIDRLRHLGKLLMIRYNITKDQEDLDEIDSLAAFLEDASD